MIHELRDMHFSRKPYRFLNLHDLPCAYTPCFQQSV